jgi:hypothetical protein
MVQALTMLRLGRAVAVGRSTGVCRAFATGAGGNQGDLVFDTFKEQQQQYQALLDGSKNIKAPLNGDEAAIKKYAQEMEALRQKVGLPDHSEALEANLEYQLYAAHGDLRGFLASTAESRDLGEYSSVLAEVERAVDAADLNTDKGLEALGKQIGDIQAKHKLDSYDKIKDAAIFDMYKQQLESLRSKVVEDMDTVKRRDNLDFVQVDPAELKAKPVL